MADRSLSLVHVTTIPLSLVALINDQVSHMRSLGYRVHAISSDGALAHEFAQRFGVVHHPVAMTRAITPARDLTALWRVWRILAALRPEIVHSHTPKGGLLGTLAAWIAGVPVRVYHLHGLRYATATGLRRAVLRSAEWFTCRLAHRVIAVSDSVRTQAIVDGVCPDDRIVVLGGGSASGVDARGRFDPDVAAPARDRVRAAFGIAPDALVIGMVGRVTREKGIVELAEAWQAIQAEMPDVHLLLVGPDEGQDATSRSALARLLAHARVHWVGHVASAEMADTYRAMDLVTLPSHREGLPNALLEAAAMRLPVVATRIPGCTDAVIDGVTGTLVPSAEPIALAAALRGYLRDPGLRALHGAAARRRVLERFEPLAIWSAIAAEYERLWRGRARYRGKRALDVIGSALALVLTAPLVVTIAAMIRLLDGAPIIVRQRRPGKDGVPFTLLKFRTMRAPPGDAAGATIAADADRTTRLGEFLRSTSLDELPQFVNVLRGDMSLVGPRPLLMDYLTEYTPRQARRHDVRPGLTGLAQVTGRNDLGWERKLELDIEYVEHGTFMQDLGILAATVTRVLRREGTGIGQGPPSRAAGERPLPPERT